MCVRHCDGWRVIGLGIAGLVLCQPRPLPGQLIVLRNERSSRERSIGVDIAHLSRDPLDAWTGDNTSASGVPT